MSSKATLTSTPLPDLGEQAKLFLVDCRHGLTTCIFLPGDPESVAWAELESIRSALAKHDAEEGPNGCRCTRELWWRYGRGGNKTN